MENKETSIQWLMSQAVNWARNTNSGNDIVEFPKGAIKQAKEIEKEQIEEAYKYARAHWSREDGNAERYYNETYGSNK